MPDKHLPTKRHQQGRELAREAGHGYYSELETFLEFKNGESNGCHSPDVKGSANDSADDGDEPCTHVSDAARIDSDKRQSVSSAVNETAHKARPSELETSEREESDSEIARRYREKYGQHDTKSSEVTDSHLSFD